MELGIRQKKAVSGFRSSLSPLDAALVAPAHALRLTHRNAFISYGSFIVTFGLLFLPVLLLLPELGSNFLVSFAATNFDQWQFVSGWLLHPMVPALSLSVAILLIVGINRAWGLNETYRERISQEIEPADRGPDVLPDLRDETIVAALVLVLFIPFWLHFLNEAVCLGFGKESCLYAVNIADDGPTMLWAWGSFTTQTLMRALVFFDFPEVYQWKSWGNVEIASSAGRHVLMLVRVMVDLLIVSSVLQVIRISRVHRDAIASLDQTEKRAALTGKRIVTPLIHVLGRAPGSDEEPLKVRYQNAALALEAIGDPRAIQGLINLLDHHIMRKSGNVRRWRSGIWRGQTQGDRRAKFVVRGRWSN